MCNRDITVSCHRSGKWKTNFNIQIYKIGIVKTSKWLARKNPAICLCMRHDFHKCFPGKSRIIGKIEALTNREHVLFSLLVKLDP